MEVSVRDVQIKYLFLRHVDAHHPHPESRIWQQWVLDSGSAEYMKRNLSDLRKNLPYHNLRKT
jgi:hypothetical protein